MNKNWTIEKIKGGFDLFISQYGRLPMALEIDKFEHLPSSRHIQNKFGGLEKLRSELGYQDTHFGKGLFRSAIANRVNKRGREVELSMEKILRQKFGEVFVHTEKIFDNSKNRIDFYIYSPDGNFGLDIFYPDSLHTLQSNVNIKMNKYHKFTHPLFMVVANDGFSQEAIDRYVHSKIKLLSTNTRVVTLNTLADFIKNKGSYPNPLKFHGGKELDDM